MNSNLSQNIRQWRKKNNLTQQAFADKFSELYRHVHQYNYKSKNIEYSFKTISTWENGTVPSFDCIMVLTQMLNMRIDEMLYNDIAKFSSYNLVSSDKLNLVSAMSQQDKSLLYQIMSYLYGNKAPCCIEENNAQASTSDITAQIFLPLIYNQDEIIISDKITGLDELTNQYFDKRQSHFIQLGIDNYNSYIAGSEPSSAIDCTKLLHKFITWDYIVDGGAGKDIDFCEPYTFYDAVSDQQSTPVDGRQVTRHNSCLYDAEIKSFAELIGLFECDINYTNNDILKLEEDALSKANSIISNKLVNLVSAGIVEVQHIEFYEIGVFNSGFAKWLKDFEDYVMLTVKINLTIDEVATLLAEHIKNKIVSCNNAL